MSTLNSNAIPTIDEVKSIVGWKVLGRMTSCNPTESQFRSSDVYVGNNMSSPATWEINKTWVQIIDGPVDSTTLYEFCIVVYIPSDEIGQIQGTARICKNAMAPAYAYDIIFGEKYKTLSDMPAQTMLSLDATNSNNNTIDLWVDYPSSTMKAEIRYRRSY